MLTWCINYIVFVQVAADGYYWFPMPYGLLKPCVLFFLRKIARNYSIVTHQKSCISLYRGVKPFTYCRPAVIDYSQDLFLLLMCLCSYFAHVTCSFFSRCLHGILCGIWYNISCERNSSVYFAHVTCSFFSRCLHGILCGIWYMTFRVKGAVQSLE